MRRALVIAVLAVVAARGWRLPAERPGVSAEAGLASPAPRAAPAPSPRRRHKHLVEIVPIKRRTENGEALAYIVPKSRSVKKKLNERKSIAGLVVGKHAVALSHILESSDENVLVDSSGIEASESKSAESGASESESAGSDSESEASASESEAGAAGPEVSAATTARGLRGHLSPEADSEDNISARLDDMLPDHHADHHADHRAHYILHNKPKNYMDERHSSEKHSSIGLNHHHGGRPNKNSYTVHKNDVHSNSDTHNFHEVEDPTRTIEENNSESLPGNEINDHGMKAFDDYDDDSHSVVREEHAPVPRDDTRGLAHDQDELAAGVRGAPAAHTQHTYVDNIPEESGQASGSSPRHTDGDNSYLENSGSESTNYEYSVENPTSEYGSSSDKEPLQKQSAEAAEYAQREPELSGGEGPLVIERILASDSSEARVGVESTEPDASGATARGVLSDCFTLNKSTPSRCEHCDGSKSYTLMFLFNK